MRRLNNKIVIIAIIIFLFPYIISVFIYENDRDVLSSTKEETLVRVQCSEEVCLVSWEEYLIGILAKEIPLDYSLEAMKAQSIIIQTRLAMEAEEDSYVYQEEYYTSEEIASKWRDYNSVDIYSQLTTAVVETSGILLYFEGNLAKTPYHLLNNGNTRDGNAIFNSEEYEYLQSVYCPMDMMAEDAIENTYISYEELKVELNNFLEGEEIQELTFEDIEILIQDEAGYILTVEIQGYEINGETFSNVLDLNSSAFSIQEEEKGIVITTQGMGHGLGLSQNTAHYMGLEGKTYIEILGYFYPGTEIIE